MSTEDYKSEFVRRVVNAALKVGKVSADTAADLANQLWSFKDESSKLAEDECNRELTREEKLRDRELDEIVKSLGEEMGLEAYRQGDPRSWTIRVVVGPEFADNWDGVSTGCG